MSQEETTRTNLAKQREVALVFWRSYSNPALTEIRFTDEGNKPGFGAPWSANAVVTVGGREFNEILGAEVWGGDPLPQTPSGSTAGPIAITFSDGTQELVR